MKQPEKGIPMPPSMEKPEIFSKSPSLEQRQKSKTKHNIYRPVEAAYQVSILSWAHIPITCFMYVHSVPYLWLRHPVSLLITHHIPIPPDIFRHFIRKSSWHVAYSWQASPSPLPPYSIDQSHRNTAPDIIIVQLLPDMGMFSHLKLWESNHYWQYGGT